MGFGIFIYRADSEYDDAPWERYQFPKRYLSEARKFGNGWVVFLEPTRAKEARAFFAVAKLGGIVPDTRLPDMYIAHVEPGTYLDFGRPVPFRDADGNLEKGLLNDYGVLSGMKQWSVRELAPEDFARIVGRGLTEEGSLEVRTPPPALDPGKTVRLLTDGDVRERNFQRTVLRAYGKRCAITGLRLINGGGRAEVSAARIRPSDQGGPDVGSNGIALSGTARWMFERGLVGIADNFEIMISRQSNDPESIGSMINDSGLLKMPGRVSERPGAEFLSWHRENRFMK